MIPYQIVALDSYIQAKSDLGYFGNTINFRKLRFINGYQKRSVK